MVDSILKGIEVVAVGIISMLMVFSGVNTLHRKIKPLIESETLEPDTSRQHIQEDLGAIQERIQRIERRLEK